MIKKNQIKKIILIMIFLVLISCTYLPKDLKSAEESIKSPFEQMDPFQKEEVIGEEIKYQKGTEGLTAKFIKTTQQKIREGSFFDIIFELQNKGYSNINRGLFKLVTEEQYVSVEKSHGAFILKGKSQYMPTGETKRIKFRVKAGRIEQEQIIEYPVKSTLIACYAYETIAANPICIDADVEGVKGNKACRVQDLILTEGQGSPVVVTKIIPKIEFGEKGAMPLFEIYIENLGEGQVTAPEYIESTCGAKSRGRSAEYDKVEVEAILSDHLLKCTPNKINIKKGKETRVICEQTTPLRRLDAYLAPLEVKIKYGYLTTAYGDVTITKGLRI